MFSGKLSKVNHWYTSTVPSLENHISKPTYPALKRVVMLSLQWRGLSWFLSGLFRFKSSRLWKIVKKAGHQVFIFVCLKEQTMQYSMQKSFSSIKTTLSKAPHGFHSKNFMNPQLFIKKVFCVDFHRNKSMVFATKFCLAPEKRIIRSFSNQHVHIWTKSRLLETFNALALWTKKLPTTELCAETARSSPDFKSDGRG